MFAGAKMTIQTNKSSNGFTLLEAIVALAIIGMTIIPVMSFLGQSAQQLTFAAESNLRTSAQQTVLAYLETLNPQLSPQGEAPLSQTLTIRWSSTPLVAPNSEYRVGGRLGTYNLGFFQVDVDVLRDGQDWFQFQVRKLGFQPKNLSLDGRPG
jgi:prepilin-type N-terminal cleavage/methylation domain-containing protein